jgi:hypothetical protein
MSDAQTLGELLAGGPFLPFDREVDTPRDLGFGGLSTEMAITEDAPGGGAWNIPTIWWKGGEPTVFSREDAARLARLHEMSTGFKFPRFDGIDEAVSAAEARSSQGGGLLGMFSQ